MTKQLIVSHVVIVGGGFGGSRQEARTLRNAPFRVTLI